jgi:hypothetical protein
MSDMAGIMMKTRADEAITQTMSDPYANAINPAHDVWFAIDYLIIPLRVREDVLVRDRHLRQRRHRLRSI